MTWERLRALVTEARLERMRRESEKELERLRQYKADQSWELLQVRMGARRRARLG